MKETMRCTRFRLLRKVLFTLSALLLSASAFAQQITVQGVVTDSENAPLPGASVRVKGTNTGVATDIEGKFSLKVDKNSALTFSYTGYITKELKARSVEMRVVLEENDQVLNEVVVVGYGSVKRKDVTTAISSVGLDDLDRRPMVTLGQAIQGKAAGVQVIAPSGQPGGDVSIFVRGMTSFNLSNAPLYVVDGVPVDNIKYLSPNDIADVQILKDASSAAIYGTRGANGVILITTKAGNKGDAKITFNGQLTMNKLGKRVDVLNAKQYKEYMDETGFANIPESDAVDRTDWFDETYQTGLSQNYMVSVSDGTEKTKYYLSAGYQDDQGIIETSFFKRYTFRANVESDVRKWLNVSANVSYADQSGAGAGPMGTGANRGGTVLATINTPTYAPVWSTVAGEEGWYNTHFNGVNITSPLENMAREKDNRNKENRLVATGGLLFKFLPELTLKSSMSIDRISAINTAFINPTETKEGREQHGKGSDTRYQTTVLTFDNVLNYNKTFGKHSLDAMVGTSWTKCDYRWSTIVGTYYAGDDIQTLNAANKISWSDTRTTGDQWGLMSYFARVSYNFDSRYIVTANMRADGSSRLHPDYRWGYFPSVSAAWRISSEEFMDGTEGWLDDLKLRVGFGQTGNQSGLRPYAYLAMKNFNRLNWADPNNPDYAQAVPNTSWANMRSQNLGWETTNQTNIGIDFSAFRSRLVVNLDYYYKHTKDLLVNVSIPNGASYANNIQRNNGEMVNQGVELTVSSKNFTGGEFEWSTDFNISHNENELKELSFRKIYSEVVAGDYVKEYLVRNEPGRSLGGFFGYISDGVDPETGELMYRDVNKDGRLSTSDRVYIGDPNPKFLFGLTNNFSYKGFNLSIFLQGSFGNDVYNASRMETEGMYDGKNQTTTVLRRWKIPGQITDVPKAGFEMHPSTYFIEDGSYLRLKNISLSYDIRARFLDKWGVSKLQPYVSLSNIATWTSYSGQDPEMSSYNSARSRGIDWGTYPLTKSYVFGLNIEF